MIAQADIDGGNVTTFAQFVQLADTNAKLVSGLSGFQKAVHLFASAGAAHVHSPLRVRSGGSRTYAGTRAVADVTSV